MLKFKVFLTTSRNYILLESLITDTLGMPLYGGVFNWKGGHIYKNVQKYVP